MCVYVCIYIYMYPEVCHRGARQRAQRCEAGPRLQRPLPAQGLAQLLTIIMIIIMIIRNNDNDGDNSNTTTTTTTTTTIIIILITAPNPDEGVSPGPPRNHAVGTRLSTCDSLWVCEHV